MTDPAFQAQVNRKLDDLLSRIPKIIKIGRRIAKAQERRNDLLDALIKREDAEN